MATSQCTQIVNEACARLAEGLNEHLRIGVVHGRLDELARSEPDDGMLRALADGCAYCLVNSDSAALGACGPFAPMFAVPNEDGVRMYPRYLGDVNNDTLDTWADCADDASLHPLVRARLADLLWVRRHQPSRSWFKVAVQAYVQLAETNVEVLDVGFGLQRAVAICTESNHSELSREPLEALEQLVKRVLDSDDDLYGVCWRAIHTLAGNGWLFSDLLDTAINRYGSDPNRKSELLDIAIGASQEAATVECLRREQIAVHEAAAAASSGLLRVSHLDTARQIAAAGGLTAHENRLTTALERTDTADDLNTIEVVAEIDNALIDSEVARIVGDDGLLPALGRFAAIVPTGDPERSRAFVTELANKHPLMSLVTRFEFGPEGGVVRRPGGHEERVEHDLGQHDAQAITLFAELSGQRVLRALNRQHGPDLPSSVVDWVSSAPAVSQEQAEQIAKALRYWIDGNSATAGSVIVDLIEPLVRGVCRQLGIRVTRTDSRVRTLGALLKDLSPHLDPARARYLESALVDSRSLNLRNRAAHGLDPETPRYQFVVLFHIACRLVCVSHLSPSDIDRQRP